MLFPMDIPAEIHRSVACEAMDIIVARGPLVIMAHGLSAMSPEDRGRCWISTPAGDLSPAEAADALRAWSRRAEG